METRHRLEVKDAGLAATSQKKKSEQTPIDPSLDILSPEVKFGRLLGGTDARKRHMAVQKLKAYLRARCDITAQQENDNSGDRGISELDLLKLWKALWYTLYMADKKPVQYELSKQLAQLIWCVAGTEEEDEYAGQAYLEMLANEEEKEEDDGEDVTLEEIENTLDRDDDEGSEDSGSGKDEDNDKGSKSSKSSNEEDENEDEEEADDAEILHCRGAHLASLFVRTFFRTLRRDWDKMDKYRVDKFYTLIRLMTHQVFKYMALRHWNFGIIRLFNDAIFDEILSKQPNGLRYHLIDLSLEELAKASAKAPMPLTEATFLDVLEPYLAICQTGGQGGETLQTRVMERIVENFLENYCVVSENALGLREEISHDSDGQEKSKKNVDKGDDEEKEDGDDGDDEEEGKVPILDQVHVGTIAEFIFNLGSDSETHDKYRKSLYEMHKKYIRRLKKVGIDVDLRGGDDEEDDDDKYRDQDEFAQAGVDDEADKEMMPYNENELRDHFETKVWKKRKSAEPLDKEKDNKAAELPDTTSKPDKKKRKRKKKRKGSDDLEPDLPDEELGQEIEKKTEEEEVVISLLEQKEAKKLGDKKKKLKRKKSTEDNDEKEGSLGYATKKVKFGRVNRSKSYQASMKALVTTVPPKTKERTPEKGILRKKEGKPSPSPLSKQNRKKAVNYF